MLTLNIMSSDLAHACLVNRDQPVHMPARFVRVMVAAFAHSSNRTLHTCLSLLIQFSLFNKTLYIEWLKKMVYLVQGSEVQECSEHWLVQMRDST